LGGTIDQLFEADMVGEIFGLVAFAGKVGECLGVLVQGLAGFEGAQTIARPCDRLPMGALGGCDGRPRTGGKLAKIFSAHTTS
jgi:hypothetical protein